MHPILFSLGPITIHTYGFLIAVGFLVAVSIIKKLSISQGLDSQKVVDLTFWTLLVGFIGCRILYVITRLDYFISDPLAVFKVWEGGLVFFGGPILGVPFLIYYFKKHKLPSWKLLDIFAPGLVVAHAFGRLGCLSAGCCYGRPTGGDWGIKLYSDLVDKPMQGIYLHPTQLYESFSLFILFGGLLWIHKNKKFDGQVALTYFIVYPIIRSIIEIFRGDTIRGFVIDGILSTSQFISLLILIASSVVLIKRLKAVEGAKK